MIKAIFLPGIGGGKTTDGWFPHLNAELTRLGIAVVAAEFPDPAQSRCQYWLPFVESLGADAETILVGYSTGAIAAMRYAESHRILGSILVGTYYTDLRDEAEKQSGYFESPWDWPAIKRNQQWIGVFASIDDPCVPIEEARYVRDRLEATYFEFTDRGHFGTATLPEAAKFIESRL